jgi:hypothetical protein
MTEEKARARAAERHPGRHETPLKWSRYLLDVAEQIGPDHPKHERYTANAAIYAIIASQEGHDR